MGLSIHYSGTIINEELMNDLIEDVADICKSLEWKTDIFDGNNADKLRGICFAPEGSEPVFLSFLPGGRLCSPINLMVRDIYENDEVDKELLYTASTKTQYAGPDAHMAIIKLLKYVSTKYFSAFHLDDEGDFWETGDENILLENFERYNALLDAVCDAFSNMNSVPGEDALSLSERIEKVLRDKFGKGL